MRTPLVVIDPVAAVDEVENAELREPVTERPELAIANDRVDDAAATAGRRKTWAQDYCLRSDTMIVGVN
jgi:hypothetical protein